MNRKNKTFFNVIFPTNEQDIPILEFIGYINKWDEISYREIRKTILELSIAYKSIKIVLNSGGGDMIEGFAIYDELKRSGLYIIVDVIGMAASMASILMCAGNKIVMSRNASIMIHRPQIMAEGESENLRSLADYADELESRMKTVYQERTGLTEEVINEWLKPGVEKWFGATQALSNNLIDEITSEVIPAENVIIPEDEEDLGISEEEVFNNYYNINFNNQNPKPMELNQLKKFLNLADTSTIEDVQNTITKIVEDSAKKDETIKDLTEQINSQEEDMIEGLVSNALANSVIKEDEKEIYKNLAKSNFENTKKIIESMTKNATRTPIFGNVGAKNADSDGSEDRKNWKYIDWAKKDPSGLSYMKINNPEAFAKLHSGK